jgi:hypothetical protein
MAIESLLRVAQADSSIQLLPWLEREFTGYSMRATGGNQVRAAKTAISYQDQGGAQSTNTSNSCRATYNSHKSFAITLHNKVNHEPRGLRLVGRGIPPHSQLSYNLPYENPGHTQSIAQ